MLAGSGAARGVLASRHADVAGYQVDCPFPLKTLPRTIGEWEAATGGETILDSLTTRITGSTDYIIWKYINKHTGAALSVLVLYGPAEPVMPHTPQVCYPATGYQSIAGPVDRSIKLDDGRTGTFRTSTFAKSGGREMVRNVVYHSFMLDGTWSPTLATNRAPRRSPGIFKIQVQRRVADAERADQDDEPIEQFLRQILPVLDQKAAATRVAAAGR